MPVTHRQTVLPGVTVQDLWDWHQRPGAFERLIAPWHRVRFDGDPLQAAGGLVEGAVASFQVSVGPVEQTWEAVHHDIQPPHGFSDTARRGPFARWTHVHRFEDGPQGAILEDQVDWAPPCGPLGLPATPSLRRSVEAMFAVRHQVTADDLADHAAFADRPRLRVGITGPSGLVGRALSAFLRTGGHTVVPFTRRAGRPGSIVWDPRGAGVDPHDLEGLDAIVHLAGEPIAQRWTTQARDRIFGSRTDGTRALAEAMAACAQGPKVLISASACGWYGDPDGVVDESSPRGEGFLADTADAWERAAGPARAAGVRVVHPRIGLVISGQGGVLTPMLPAFRMGLGGPIGRGTQGFPWVARDDLVRMIHAAMWDETWSGPFNAVGPSPCDQRTFARTLGQALRRPAFAPVPGPAVRLLGGDAGRALLLGGQHVRAGVLHARGFRWRHPELGALLRRETGRPEA